MHLREPRIITIYSTYATRKIGDDAKEDSQANPTIMATIAKSATRAKLKVSYIKRTGVSVPSRTDGGGVVDHGKVMKCEKKGSWRARKRMWTFSSRCFNVFFFLICHREHRLKALTIDKLSYNEDIYFNNHITAKNLTKNQTIFYRSLSDIDINKDIFSS